MAKKKTAPKIGTAGIPNTAKTYEHFIGKKSEEAPRALTDFMDEEDVLDENDPLTWENLWGGMPMYVPNNNEPIKQVIISFDSMEDYEAFGRVTGIPLTPKTKSAYYPPRAQTVLDVFRWVDDGEADKEEADKGVE
jgi:hypothetical protein